MKSQKDHTMNFMLQKDKIFQQEVPHCKRCGKAFAYKTSLIQHIKLHEGDKPFQCAHCSKRFTQKGNLEEHIRTHTGEKPFPCSLCDRRFTTSSQHKMHEKLHKGNKDTKMIC